MINDNVKLTGLAALIATVPLAAFAGLTLGDQAGTTDAEIRAMMEAQGYEVLEIEIEDDEIEVDYVLDGVEYEAEIDPATGAIIALELEDEDDEDEDDSEDDDS